MKKLGKYSFGIGDRFGRQGHAQLKAVIEAGKKGYEITPVWNKSNREHIIIGTHPEDVRQEADQATRTTGYRKPFFVDADHINYDNVDRFIESSDYFTIDVAAFIGKRAGDEEIENFISGVKKYESGVKVPGIKKTQKCSGKMLVEIAEKYLFAARKAGEIYRKIEGRKGRGNFITEISMDEVPQSQSPVEIFFILKMLGDEKIPLQTIAPKFSGRFNKGVDYIGDIRKFVEEFEQDLLVLSHAANEFNLPDNLKISVHSGSDKFSLYPLIGSIIRKHDKGLHVKTAGTTWLEEVIGLAEAGNEALDFVKEIYSEAVERMDELCGPYADVIDIDRSKLPSSDEVAGWNSRKFAASLRHEIKNPDYNQGMRQLIHVGYKLAAQNSDRFYRLLSENEHIVEEGVYQNIYTRHLCRLFDIK
jgi:hypothetical protein